MSSGRVRGGSGGRKVGVGLARFLEGQFLAIEWRLDI